MLCVLLVFYGILVVSEAGRSFRRVETFRGWKAPPLSFLLFILRGIDPKLHALSSELQSCH